MARGKPRKTGRALRAASFLLPRRSKDRRRLELLGGAAVVLFSLVISGPFVLSGFHRYALRSPEVAAVVTAILVELANHDRAGGGVGNLTMNPRLVAAAEAKAKDMAEKGYFAHESPEGYDSWHWFAEVGYQFEHAGENLAVDFSDSADVERAWMDSPSHRENILNGNYSEVGIATAQGMYQGRTTTFVVQMFGSPAFADESVSALAQSAAPSEESILPSAEPAVALVSEPSEAQVLGTQAAEAHTAASELARYEKTPWWGYIVGFPRDTLLYTYFAIGFLILLTLSIETGLEFKWHHRRRAVRAAALLLLACVFYVAASSFFFAEPVLALVAG